MKTKRKYKHRPYQPVADLSNTSSDQQQKVIELYTSGLSQTQIEKDLKMTRKTIRTIIKGMGIDRSKSLQWRIRHGCSLNEEIFDTLTPEAEYWIGFLYADGHISEGNKGYSIEVGVHTQDKNHIQKLLTFLGSDNKISKASGKEYYRTRFGSERIHSSLKSYGFTNHKSIDAVPDTRLINSRDFWRGVVDGDGSLSQKYQLKIIIPLFIYVGLIQLQRNLLNFYDVMDYNLKLNHI